MLLLPAIDLKAGRCVRLRMGDFETAETVADDVIETVLRFEAAGAKWIHIVDLDAAKGEGSSNFDVVKTIVKSTKMRVELGGGLRDMASLKRVFDLGISRAVIGSAAVTNPHFLADAVGEYDESICVGIDAKDGRVRISGWCEGTDIYTVELAKRCEDAGVKFIAFTDISRDGMLSGPNLQALQELKCAVSCDIIASGGIANIGDLQCVAALDLYGAIVGKAIYSGDIDLESAVKICSSL